MRSLFLFSASIQYFITIDFVVCTVCHSFRTQKPNKFCSGWWIFVTSGAARKINTGHLQITGEPSHSKTGTCLLLEGLVSDLCFRNLLSFHSLSKYKSQTPWLRSFFPNFIEFTMQEPLSGSCALHWFVLHLDTTPACYAFCAHVLFLQGFQSIIAAFWYIVFQLCFPVEILIYHHCLHGPVHQCHHFKSFEELALLLKGTELWLKHENLTETNHLCAARVGTMWAPFFWWRWCSKIDFLHLLGLVRFGDDVWRTNNVQFEILGARGQKSSNLGTVGILGPQLVELNFWWILMKCVKLVGFWVVAFIFMVCESVWSVFSVC